MNVANRPYSVLFGTTIYPQEDISSKSTYWWNDINFK